MTRTTRTAARAAAGALTLAVALGAGSAVSASAAPHAEQGKAAHALAAKGTHAQRSVLLRIAVLDARLLRAAGDSRSAQLDSYVRDQVLANIAGDRQTLSQLAAGLMDHPSNLAVVRETVSTLRVANYRLVVNQLAQADQISAKISEARTAVAGDPAAPVADLDAAALAVEEAVYGALNVDGFSSKGTVRAVRASLAAAQAALDVVEDYRASVGTPEMG